MCNINNYELHWPIEYGNFNQKYTFFTVCDDIHKIVDWALVNVLQIKRKDYGLYNVVLIIPDLFVKTQLKGLINVFLKVMGFKGIFLNTESVMNTYGSSLQSAW